MLVGAAGVRLCVAELVVWLRVVGSALDGQLYELTRSWLDAAPVNRTAP